MRFAKPNLALTFLLFVPLFHPLVAWTQEVERIQIEQIHTDRDGNFIPDRLGQRVTVKGTITSPPNPLNKSACFSALQDSTGGIVVFSSDPRVLVDRFGVGDVVEVTGRVSQYKGLELLAISNILKLATGPIPAPKDVAAADLTGELYSGQLVRLTGELLVPKNLAENLRGLKLRDDSGEIPVVLLQRSFADTKFINQLIAGGRVEIIGIAGQISQEAPFDAGYCIYPRTREDVHFVPPTPYRALIGILIALCGLSFVAYLWARSRDAERHAGEMRRVLDDLKRSEALYSSLVESLPQNIFRKDLDGRFTFVNQRLCHTLGKPAEEILGKTSADLFPADLAQKYEQDDRHIIETKEPFESIEERQAADGKTTYLQVVKTPLTDSQKGVIGVQGISWDITERRMLEQQLRQIQKMDSIGQLAGGIAHDFNNILTVIKAHTALLLNETTLPEKIVGPIDDIARSADRAANLIRQLLMFGRRQVMQTKDLDLNEVVINMSKMLHRVLGEHIVLKVESSAFLPPINADIGMVEQVILNLAVNSRDAMPKGGELVIATSLKVIGPAETVNNPEASPGQFVCLRVSDTGCGIPPEHLPLIFDPFFTTKDIGKGTGLGLATAYGIVKQHLGWIQVTSVAGQGTTFKVYFPAVSAVTQIPSSPKIDTEMLGGSETILVVEDERTVRMLVTMLLRRLGYRVFEASSGLMARAIWQAHGSEIDLLLTDIVMPDGMSGRELAEQLLRDRPELKVIFTSGYNTETLGSGLVLEEGVNFVSKPFNVVPFTRMVRERLDGKK